MSAKYKVNSKVQWPWLGRAILGQVEEIFFDTIKKEIKGKKITRHGTKENPAYLVKSDAGNLALKLESELKPVESKPKSKVKMFS